MSGGDRPRLLPALLPVAAALLRRTGDLPQPVNVIVAADGAGPAIILGPPAFTEIADARASIDTIAQALDTAAALHLESVRSYRASGTFQDTSVLALVVQPQIVPDGLQSFTGVRATTTGQVADLLTELADSMPELGEGLISTLVVHDHQDHLSVQAMFPSGRETEAADAIAARLPVQVSEHGWASALLPSGHVLRYNTLLEQPKGDSTT